MIYAYTYTLCSRAVIAALDSAAANLHMLDSDLWLSCRKNVIVLRLATPAWVGAELVEAVPASKTDVMRGWTVAKVVALLQARLYARSMEFVALTFCSSRPKGCALSCA